jgi:dolichol-phosphate mannosyltransferase
MASPRTLIIIPTYNERENISKMVAAVMELQKGYHILFVDDNSPDGTSAQIEAVMEKHPEVFLEKRAGKLGLGTAYIHGFKWGLARDYTYLIEMDCDFSHNPKDLPRLVQACEGGADCQCLRPAHPLDQHQRYYGGLQMLPSSSARTNPA